MTHSEHAVGAKRTGIERTSLAILTPIVGDGMEVGGGVLPGNGRARSNMDEFGRIIRREGAQSNAKGRGSCDCKRTDHKQTAYQEGEPSSFQWPVTNGSVLHGSLLCIPCCVTNMFPNLSCSAFLASLNSFSQIAMPPFNVNYTHLNTKPSENSVCFLAASLRPPIGF